MEVFGVFEGGGAKGFAHVGALRAAEERGFRFRAVAGTSIGALIASLVAAGFTSSDLFHVGDDAKESGLLSDDLERLFLDQGEYDRVLRFRGHLEWLFRKPEPGFRTYLTDHVASRSWLSWSAAIFAANASIFPLIWHRKVLGDLWWEAGAVSTVHIRSWINDTIRFKLGLPEGTDVRFQDLPIDLRVVATDLTRGDMQIFGRDKTPDTPVADAVTASMAYPLVFKPVRVGDSVFVDGGLTSNAPAWVLDDLRDMADARIPTFAFRLSDPLPSSTPARSSHGPVGRRLRKVLDFLPKASSERPKLGPMARRFVASSLNSRSVLETRRIDEFHLIELNAQLNTLDFDVVNANKAATVEHGARGVAEYLSRKIGPRDPALMERALRAFAAVVKARTNAVGTVRSYILQPSDEIVGRVVYSAMLEGDADDSLAIKLDTRSQALSLKLREPVLMRPDDIPTADLTRTATKYLHAARPSEVTSVVSVPMFDSSDAWAERDPLLRPKPIAALCFDFRDDYIEYLLLEPEIEDLLAAIAQLVGEFWTDRPIVHFESLEDGEEVASGDWISLEGSPGFYVSGRKVRAQVGAELADELAAVVTRVGDETTFSATRGFR